MITNGTGRLAHTRKIKEMLANEPGLNSLTAKTRTVYYSTLSGYMLLLD